MSVFRVSDRDCCDETPRTVREHSAEAGCVGREREGATGGSYRDSLLAHGAPSASDTECETRTPRTPECTVCATSSLSCSCTSDSSVIRIRDDVLALMDATGLQDMSPTVGIRFLCNSRQILRG